MAGVGSGCRPCAVSVTRVAAAHDGRAQFAVWQVHGGNVGVFARTGLVDRRGAVRAGGAQLGRRVVKVWDQR